MTAREEIADIHSRLATLHARLAVLYREGAGSPPAEHDEPADVQAVTPTAARTSDCPLRTGGALYGWSKDHSIVNRVNLLGRSRGYPQRMLDWSPDQVADIYHEVVSKGRPGQFAAGKPAGKESRR